MRVRGALMWLRSRSNANGLFVRPHRANERNFDPECHPELTLKQTPALGVFCGKYMADCQEEFPTSWFARAKLSPQGRDCSLNYFAIDASQPLSMWAQEGLDSCR
jgi:hypothetical protein